MPIPVSMTEKAITFFALESRDVHIPSPFLQFSFKYTFPFSVNLKALDNRFLNICNKRLKSVFNHFRHILSYINEKSNPFIFRHMPKHAFQIIVEWLESALPLSQRSLYLIQFSKDLRISLIRAQRSLT